MGIHKLILEDAGFEALKAKGYYFIDATISNKTVRIYLDCTNILSWRLTFDRPPFIDEESYMYDFEPHNINSLTTGMMDMAFNCGIADQKSKIRTVLLG